MDNQQPIVSPSNSPEPTAPSSSEAPTSSPVKAEHAHKLIFIYVVLIVLAAVAGGIYTWQHNKVAADNKQVAALTTQITSLQKQVSTLQKSIATTLKSSTTSTSSSQLNQNLIKIPTLGVQMYVPNAVKDLTITPVQSPGTYNGQPVISVNVSTTTISNDIPACKDVAFGTLTKYEGQYPSSGVALTSWHEQFSGYYLALSPGEGPCAPSTTSQTNQDLLQAQSAVFDAALPSVMAIN